MPRDLTTNERNVLEHVVVDADAWWEHANSIAKTDHEAAISDKVASWQTSYDTASAEDGYAKRSQRLKHTSATGRVDLRIVEEDEDEQE